MMGGDLLFDRAVDRLRAFGYAVKAEDKPLLGFAVGKVSDSIRNECNVSEIPDGLLNAASDMAAGEFLMAKKAFAPADIAGINLEAAVRQVQVGDTSTVFAVGDGCLTDEQRLDLLIRRLLDYGRSELACYRKIRW